MFSVRVPVYTNCSFYFAQYNVPRAKVDQSTIWLTVWDYDRFSQNEFLGEVYLQLSLLDLSRSTPQWYMLQDRVCWECDPPAHLYMYVFLLCQAHICLQQAKLGFVCEVELP